MFESGQSIAHFKIVRKLGEGGMGAVYLAEDQKLGRKVAIKVLLRNLFSDDESRARFDREARTAAQINNHHVMSIYEIGTVKPDGEDESINYIVMEYIPGQPLIGYIKQNNCGMDDILSLAEKIASGLSAAHKLNIVHRDIKPSNIIVNDDGDAKILDFGLAKLSDSIITDDGDSASTISQELTRAGKIVGTVSYMSPEQARGEALDTRADVFSFGILLYRMATGELPFASETQVSTLAKILETKHEAPHLKRADIPQELERIIDKCLQKKPSDRYQDTRDLLVDLRSLRKQYDSGITDSISAVSGEAKASKTYVFSLKKPLIAVAAVVLLLWAYNNFVGGDSTEQSSQSVVAAENSLAILEFENKTGDEDLNWLETGLPEILLTDLSQAHSIKLISLNKILDYLDQSGDQEPSHEDYISAAEKLGAVNVLSGAFYKLGDKVRIDARLLETSSGRIIFAEKVIGDDPFLLVDSLTNKIAQSLNVDKLPGDDKSVSEYTSSSPEAYKLYLDGMERFKEESFEEAIVKFNEALEIDSTFALPYMRIGMANVFEGNQTAGMKYFELAKKYEHKLPLKERSIVDIYADIWLSMEYDNAMIKMESFVQNYPDDKEGRAIYGLLIDALTGDKDKALAQLDSALLIDPKYALGYEFYMQVAENHDDLDLAIEYAIRFLEIEPLSYSAQSLLASYLLKQKKYDEAKRRYLSIIDDFANEGAPHRNVAKIYLIERKFDSARIYNDNYKQINKDSPLKTMRYYLWMGNLENWTGNFNKGLEYCHLAIEQARKTKDSNSTFSAYKTAALFYHRMGLMDSAVIFLDSSYVWARPLQKISYPMGLVATDLTLCDKARPLLDKESQEFKSRVPSELWGMVDNMKRIFESVCAADTLAMITDYERMLDESTMSKQNLTQDTRRLAQLLIIKGNFEKGRELLVDIRESGFDLTNAYYYLIDTYYISRANEGLGNLPAAKDGYQEVLRYWKDADIQIEPIKDSKIRLAKLTG